MGVLGVIVVLFTRSYAPGGDFGSLRQVWAAPRLRRGHVRPGIPQSGAGRFAFVALLLLALPVEAFTFHRLLALPRLHERRVTFWYSLCPPKLHTSGPGGPSALLLLISGPYSPRASHAGRVGQSGPPSYKYGQSAGFNRLASLSRQARMTRRTSLTMRIQYTVRLLDRWKRGLASSIRAQRRLHLSAA